MKYLAYGHGISPGMMDVIPGNSIEEAGREFTKQFGHDPLFIFTELEMDMGRQRVAKAYINMTDSQRAMYRR